MKLGVCQVNLRLLLMDRERDSVRADTLLCAAPPGASALYAVFTWI